MNNKLQNSNNWKSKAERDKVANKTAKLSALSALAQCVIAASSLFISAATIYLFIAYRNEDRINTEAQSSPLLAFIPDRNNLELRFENVGGGPAIIKYLKLTLDDRTLVVKEAPVPAAISNEVSSMQRQMFEKFAQSEMLSQVVSGGSKFDYGQSGFVLLPGAVFPVDGKNILYKIDTSEAHSKKDFVKEKYLQWSSEFGKTSPTADIENCYCSLSGKTCRIINMSKPSWQEPVASCDK